MTKKDAEKALTAFTEVVAKELKKGEKIQLVGFGTFEVAERAARKGINPKTKEEIDFIGEKRLFVKEKSLKFAVFYRFWKNIRTFHYSSNFMRSVNVLNRYILSSASKQKREQEGIKDNIIQFRISRFLLSPDLVYRHPISSPD